MTEYETEAKIVLLARAIDWLILTMILYACIHSCLFRRIIDNQENLKHFIIRSQITSLTSDPNTGQTAAQFSNLEPLLPKS